MEKYFNKLIDLAGEITDATGVSRNDKTKDAISILNIALKKLEKAETIKDVESILRDFKSTSRTFEEYSSIWGVNDHILDMIKTVNENKLQKVEIPYKPLYDLLSKFKSEKVDLYFNDKVIMPTITTL